MARTDEREQINVRLETELYEFITKYSRDNYKTVTGVIREWIASMYKASKAPPLVVKKED